MVQRGKGEEVAITAGCLPGTIYRRQSHELEQTESGAVFTG